MNPRTVPLSRFSAPACATMITAVSVWAFVNSTASSERDPFQFAAIMSANAKARDAQAIGPQDEQPPQEVPVSTPPPDLLAPPPACLESCV